MIVIDTNVLSGIIASERDSKLDEWLDEVGSEALWLTSVVVFESKGGLDAMPEGRRKHDLLAEFNYLLTIEFRDRIAPFDTEAALAAARIGAERKRRGRPTGIIDTQIAGIVVSRDAAIATRNVRHFADLQVEVIDPWAGA